MAQVSMAADEYVLRLERRLAKMAIELEALHEELDRRLRADQAAESADEAPSEEKPVRLKRLPDREAPPDEAPSGA